MKYYICTFNRQIVSFFTYIEKVYSYVISKATERISIKFDIGDVCTKICSANLKAFVLVTVLYVKMK
jgi:hypothetical protein